MVSRLLLLISNCYTNISETPLISFQNYPKFVFDLQTKLFGDKFQLNNHNVLLHSKYRELYHLGLHAKVSLNRSPKGTMFTSKIKL
ncbi:CLUMA_CG012407, isoform A [Clunio marinus]|uniref:CLUMA_CG012407, isoform A n=1 Tax=Clunio marinus TaxID=568069 RepID=A0A1J1IEK0_9DIPT|nr:CLUMA_CG012407, isoform A [Clunio marinus]